MKVIKNLYHARQGKTVSAWISRSFNISADQRTMNVAAHVTQPTLSGQIEELNTTTSQHNCMGAMDSRSKGWIVQRPPENPLWVLAV
jgi:hypothetical protein